VVNYGNQSLYIKQMDSFLELDYNTSPLTNFFKKMISYISSLLRTSSLSEADIKEENITQMHYRNVVYSHKPHYI